MFNFYLYHNNSRRFDLSRLAKQDTIHLWETCQRQIIITPSRIGQLCPQFQEFSNHTAFVFLLETVLGLHSKLLGEPEVLGQFKNSFLQMPLENRWDYQANSLYRFIAKEAKRIRTIFLKSNGQMTYGGLIKDYIQKESEIDIIGSGHLAQELLPWLLNTPATIKCFNRNISTAKQRLDPLAQRVEKRLQHYSFAQLNFSGCLIIAAPLDSLILNGKLKKSLDFIIDLRDNSHLDKLQHKKVVTLNQLYTQKHSNQQALQKKIPQIKQEIGHAANKWFFKPIHRPLGWEETCLYA